METLARDDRPSATKLTGGTLRKRKATFGAVPRRSLRVIAQGSSETVIAKAQKLAQVRDVAGSSSSGITLLTRFPFPRLTDEEIEQLFQVYNIRFGLANLDRHELVSAIQTLSRADFDRLITSARYC